MVERTEILEKSRAGFKFLMGDLGKITKPP